VNRAHPGHASYVEIKDANHLLAISKKISDEVVPKMLEWMQKQLTPN